MSRKTDKGLKAYVVGFVLSIVLTVTAYVMVVQESFSYRWLIAAIIGLAIIQFVVQVVFFLHIGREGRPRFNLLTLFFMVLVVLILVLGSLWIMANLNYHHNGGRATPEETERYIIEDEGIEVPR